MNKKFLLYLLPLIFLACKKDRPEPIPDPVEAEQPKLLKSTRLTNTNGHSILTTYKYNSDGKLYQEITRDEVTGAEMVQDYIYKNGILTRSVISNEQRQLSAIRYNYENNMLTSMKYFEYDTYQRQEFLFERYLEYKTGKIYKISTKNISGEVSEYTLFIFSGNNVSETKTFSVSGMLRHSCSYEYDQKINPYFGHYGQLQVATGYSSSNVTRSVQTDHVNGSVIRYNYEYQYRPFGQPSLVFSATDKVKPLIAFYY